MGKDPSVALQVPPEYGHGGDVYVASVAVLHKIHCLDFLRMNIYFDYYLGEAYPDREVTEGHQGHTNHCLEVVRQWLVCDASTDVVPFIWYEDSQAIDYIMNDKCGNFDGITEWAADRALTLNPFSLRKPKGQATAQTSDLWRVTSWY